MKLIMKALLGLTLALGITLIIWFIQITQVQSQLDNKNQENIQLKEQLDNSITWDIAQKLKALQDTRSRMTKENDNLSGLNAIKEELEAEIIDTQTNYNLLHESATILKEDIKESQGLN